MVFDLNNWCIEQRHFDRLHSNSILMGQVLISDYNKAIITIRWMKSNSNGTNNTHFNHHLILMRQFSVQIAETKNYCNYNKKEQIHLARLVTGRTVMCNYSGKSFCQFAVWDALSQCNMQANLCNYNLQQNYAAWVAFVYSSKIDPFIDAFLTSSLLYILLLLSPFLYVDFSFEQS